MDPVRSRFNFRETFLYIYIFKFVEHFSTVYFKSSLVKVVKLFPDNILLGVGCPCAIFMFWN